MRIFTIIHPSHLIDVTGGSKRITVRKDNSQLVQAMTTLKSDIENMGRAQIEKANSSSQMLPMMMMMMQRR